MTAVNAEHTILLGGVGTEPDASLREDLEKRGYVIAGIVRDQELLDRVRHGQSLLAIVSAAAPLDAEGQALLRELFRTDGRTRLLIISDGEVGPDSALAHPGYLRLPRACSRDEIINGARDLIEGTAYHWASELHEPAARATLQMVSQDEATEGLRFFLQFARELSRHASFEKMLDFALQELMRLFHCESGSIYLWDAEHRELVLRTAFGPNREERVGHRQRVGEGVAGWVASVGEPLLVSDVRRVARLAQRGYDRYSTNSCLCAPLKQDGQLVGVVALTMRKEREFTEKDLELITGLCQDLFAEVGPINVVAELRQFHARLQQEVERSRASAAEKERQLRDLQVFSANIIDTIPIGIVTYDRDLRVRFANDRAREIIALGGVDYENAIPLRGLHISEALWRERLRSVLDKGETISQHRIPFGPKEPDERLLDIKCCPLRGANDEITGGLITIEDITEEARLERKLIRSERLAYLGKLASRVAHELNNPLDGILRFINLALNQLRHDPDRTARYLEESKRGLLRMANIITELLVFSRNQYGQGQPKTLDAVVLDSVALFEERAASNGIRLEVELPSALPLSPSRELDEVFCNLIKNAVDAMPDGGVLRIDCQVGENGITFHVADSGPGIPVEIRDKVFEPFFTTKGEGAGTGLGLAICRDIVNRLGGNITLEPSERGAAFRITLPLDSTGNAPHE